MQEHRQMTLSDDSLKKIQERIENLRVDLGASGALLLSDSGQLLVECGRLRGFDLDVFLALLGNAMSAMNAVVHLLKDYAAFDLNYHEGQNYEMYTTRLSDHVFLALMLERGEGTTSRIGMIWLSLRHAVTDLRALLRKSMAEPGSTTSREFKSAVSKTLDEKVTLLDDVLLAPTNALAMPAPTSTPALPPIDDERRPRRKLPGRDQSPTETVLRPRRKLPGRDIPPAQTVEPSKPNNQMENPSLSPDILDDPNHILTYEEARALGLIDLDNLEADS